ncbi:hypothetical protein MN608_05985 [Microdochium nivale]|nr:hypothetical protein MN608_05985 [Microdochium nivale]
MSTLAGLSWNELVQKRWMIWESYKEDGILNSLSGPCHVEDSLRLRKPRPKHTSQQLINPSHVEDLVYSAVKPLSSRTHLQSQLGRTAGR